MFEVVVAQRRLPHYRVSFFEQLRERLREEGVNLRLIVGQPNDIESAKGDGGTILWAEHKQNRYFPIASRDLVWQPCLTSLRSCDLVIVEQASRLLLNYVLLGWRLIGGPKLAFWGHGKNLDEANASSLAELLKRKLASSADWWFCYTSLTARVVEDFGVPERKCTVVQNAVDTRTISEFRDSLTSEDLDTIRRQLGLTSGPVAIALGSIYPSKRPAFLIEAADVIRASVPTFELIVIGDGPNRSVIEQAAGSRPWVHSVGALTGMEMTQHAALGSVVLNPGLVGLAILDAFALGLPMITCDLPYHSPEVEYLLNDVNGAILPTNATPTDFGNYVAMLLSDTERLSTLQQSALQAARSYTIEEMVENFTRGVLGALHSASSRDLRAVPGAGR